MKNFMGTVVQKTAEAVVQKTAEMVVGDYLGRSDMDNMQSLKRNWQELSCKAFDVEEEVNREEMSGKKRRKNEVDIWLKDVKKISPEINALETRGSSWRLLLEEDPIGKLQLQVKKLTEQSHHFNGLVLDAYDNIREPCLRTKLFGEKFKQILERIWPCLVIDDISSIGIYGMGGVGKTTLAKHIKYHLSESTNYRVLWVTVSQDFSITNLQDKIANVLGIQLSNRDEEEVRADILRGAFRKKEKLVLILDDVWQEFCLDRVGIPLDANKCRLILTTRSEIVCDRMQCQRKFNLKTLEANEAWDLFKNKLGNKTLLCGDVEDIAKSMAKRCAGLPLGIITVAGSMKGISDICEWRNALNQLKACSVRYDEMERDVFPILEWSFNRLNECLKPCFLYCCLYPEDSEIERDELIDLFIWAELIAKQDLRSKELDEGHTILNKLVKVCLLEETTDWMKNKCVRMHDLVRDMALRITNGNSTSTMSGDAPRFLVKSLRQGISTERLEPEEWTENLFAVSYSSYQDKQLEIEVPLDWSPNCPELSTLLLSFIYTKGSLDSFFMRMSRLKVMKLSHCSSIEKLPNSVSDMVNLAALILNGCHKLQSVPSLEKLKKLRELNLSSTAIQDLPQGFELLVSLESLNLKYCNSFRRKMIPEGTFSKLDRLQRLELPTHGTIQVNDPEVLNRLEILEGYFLFTDFYKISRWPKCDYRLCITEFSMEPVDYFHGFSKGLTFQECNLGRGSNCHVPWLPDDMKHLILWKCEVRGIGCLSDAFKNLMSLNGLSCLEIVDLEGIEFLLQLSSDLAPSPLPNLQKLELRNLPNLVGLFDGGSQAYLLPSGTFSSLTKLKIFNCNNMKQLLTLQLLRNLENLEKLHVEECKELEEIVADEDGVEHGGRGDIQSTSTESATIIALPKLQWLDLENLPKLKNICSAAMICNSILEIWIRRCPNVKRLPLFLPITINGQLSPPSNLRSIMGDMEWWESLEWDNSYAKSALDPFFIADHDYCLSGEHHMFDKNHDWFS